MAAKVRKQIYLEPEQEERLKQLSAETGVPEAEIIREAIEQQLTALQEKSRDEAAWQAELEFMRQRAEKATTQGERTWTREELYDRK